MVLEYEPYRRRFTSVKVDGKYYPFDRRRFEIPKCSGCRSERRVLRMVAKLNKVI